MDDTPSRYEALKDAIAALGGTQAELARICKVSPTAVWKWVQSSKQLPAEFVLDVEAATGISRHRLRPDIYPADLPCSNERWLGVDQQANRVSFQTSPVLKGKAA